MNQMTFSDMEYSGRKRVTQKEKFLQEMNEIILWAAWVNKIQPYYPEGKRGRPPRGIEVMLRMYLLQIWFNLSDEGLEDAIYDSYAMRSFVDLNFLEEQGKRKMAGVKARKSWAFLQFADKVGKLSEKSGIYFGK